MGASGQNPPPRVLQVSQPVSDGVAVVVADMTTGLTDLGWDVIVASPLGGELPGWVRRGGARHVPWSAGREIGAQVPSEVRDLRALIQGTRPHVVHLHSSKAGLAGRLAIRGRVPTVFTPHAWSYHHVHGPMRGAALAWERLATRWTDVILSISQAEADTGRADGISGNYVVLPNASHIPDPGLDRDRARAHLGLDAGPLAICVGRYAEQKGQDILLAAWPAIEANVPGAKLVLVGSGPMAAQLAAAAPPGVELRPAGGREAVAKWIRASDVMVFPSRWEGMSLAVLEALELGRPVVVSDAQGMAEALAGGAGRQFQLRHPDQLVAQVSELLGDPDLASGLGREAAARFAAVHGQRRLDNQARYRDLLLALASGDRGRSTGGAGGTGGVLRTRYGTR